MKIGVGFMLKYDYRNEDGSFYFLIMYGGYIVDEGFFKVQLFFVDVYLKLLFIEFGIVVLMDNVW